MLRHRARVRCGWHESKVSRIENGKTGLKRAEQSVLPLWQRTRRFRTYSPWINPGAVQTPSYTRAVLRSFMHRRNLRDDIEDAVKVRTDRLRLLHEATTRSRC